MRYTLEIYLGYGEVTRDATGGEIVEGAFGDGCMFFVARSDDLDELRALRLPGEDAFIYEWRGDEQWLLGDISRRGEWRVLNERLVMNA